MSELYTVLTGDLVKSSKLDPAELDAVREAFFAAADQIKLWQEGLIVGAPEFYRGDAWQLLLSDPSKFLRVALYIRTALRQKRWDTRIAIGIGGIDNINRRQISLSVGESFTLSGHSLDAMGSTAGFTFDAPPGLKARTGWVQPMLDLCDALVGRLKPRQSEMVCEALAPSGPSQSHIATRLGISQQAVSAALVSAGWSAIANALAYAEGFDWGAA